MGLGCAILRAFAGKPSWSIRSISVLCFGSASSGLRCKNLDHSEYESRGGEGTLLAHCPSLSALHLGSRCGSVEFLACHAGALSARFSCLALVCSKRLLLPRHAGELSVNTH